MLTLDDDQLRLLSRYEDTLGPMLVTLAFPQGLYDEAGLHPEIRKGWTRCDPGDVAAALHEGAPMQGYTQEGSDVVVTLIQTGDEVAIHVEGEGWAIEAADRHAGWMQSGDRSWPGIASGGLLKHVHAEEPWPLDGRDAIPEDHEPRIYGPSGQMRMESGVLVNVAMHVPASPTSDLPAWLREGYDWDAAIAANPDGTLSRIHVLATTLGVTWEDLEPPRLLHGMMERIETRLGIETTNPEIGGHRLQIGARVTAAETAVVRRAG